MYLFTLVTLFFDKFFEELFDKFDGIQIGAGTRQNWLCSLSQVIQELHNPRTTNATWSFRAWADSFWWIHYWWIHFGVISANLSAPILVLCVPCPFFPLINHYFLQRYKPLHPNSQLFIWDLDMGRKELGDLAIVCLYSVVQPKSARERFIPE